MICPRCTTALLVRQVQDNVVIDVCATCRGVWLDRGELAALNAIAIAAARHADDREGEASDDEPKPLRPDPAMRSRMIAAFSSGRL